VVVVVVVVTVVIVVTHVFFYRKQYRTVGRRASTAQSLTRAAGRKQTTC
jgi:hypothetical protein